MRIRNLRAFADRRPERCLLPGAQAYRHRSVRRARRVRAPAGWSSLGAGAADRARAGPGDGRAARRHGPTAIGCAAVKVTRLPDVERRTERSVAVGTFDGVHVGHREVIRGADSVLTFDPHPVSVVAPQHTPKLLTTLRRKAELVAALGVRELIVIRFDRGFAACSATEFIDDVLVGAL